MLHRGGIALAFASALVAFVVAGSSSCSSSSSGVGLTDSCTINSDCNPPLICAFARCHQACVESRDCPDGERCLFSGTGGVCQLTQESTCTGASATCSVGQVCGADKQCRELCASMSDCAMGDFCLPSGGSSECYSPSNVIDEAALMAAGVLSPDGAVLVDGSFGLGPDGSPSLDGSPTGAQDGTSGGRESGGPTGNSCPSAQTQFSITSIGDSNPNFTSGVGARTATQLLAFDSYIGPDPAGDGGGLPVAAIYDQAFDPVSGASAGPATLLTTVKNLDVPGNDAGYQMTIMSSAIAPTGDIALLYSVRFAVGGGYDETDLCAVFLAVGGDGGAGLSVKRTVLLTTATVYQQPFAIWSTTSNAFVFSWYDNDGGQYTTIQKFLVNGAPAGGNSMVVPTDNPNNTVAADSQLYQGAVAETQGLFGAAYESSVDVYTPALTVLDPTGTQVGTSVLVASHAVSGNPVWTAIAGTAQGFVYLYDLVNGGGGVAVVYVPVTGDAGVVGSETDAASFAGFTFPGTVHANEGRAVADSANGAGGVGVSLLYPSGVSFAYVQADGAHHVGPSTVLPHTVASGDYTSLTNLNGSFVVSLYGAATHETQIAASGCTP